jgi:metalloendopeptidase OMA1, mitochondrial
MYGKMRLLPIVLFGLFFAYYWFSHQEKVPLTGRTQLVDISREQEAALGLDSYREVLAKNEVIESGPEVESIRAIGARLATAAKDMDPGFDWQFNLLRSDEVNAFCLPGGKVAVYTGLLPIAQNADGLAVVMGHEIAHALARHGAERMAHEKLMQIGQMAAGVALADMDMGERQAVLGALGAGAQFGILLPFSREHESEADHIGLLLAARGCFNPAEAVHLWERMSQNSNGQPPEFASTHPSHATRIEQLTNWMPEAEAERAKYCSGATGAAAGSADRDSP